MSFIIMVVWEMLSNRTFCSVIVVFASLLWGEELLFLNYVQLKRLIYDNI